MLCITSAVYLFKCKSSQAAFQYNVSKETTEALACPVVVVGWFAVYSDCSGFESVQAIYSEFPIHHLHSSFIRNNSEPGLTNIIKLPFGKILSCTEGLKSSMPSVWKVGRRLRNHKNLAPTGKDSENQKATPGRRPKNGVQSELVTRLWTWCWVSLPTVFMNGDKHLTACSKNHQVPKSYPLKRTHIVLWPCTPVPRVRW